MVDGTWAGHGYTEMKILDLMEVLPADALLTSYSMCETEDKFLSWPEFIKCCSSMR